MGDVVWLADQNALRSQYKLPRVVSVNADRRGIVRDVNVRTFPSYPVPVVRPSTGGDTSRQGARKLLKRIPVSILCRDVRRLVILLPVEEQLKTELDRV